MIPQQAYPAVIYENRVRRRTYPAKDSLEVAKVVHALQQERFTGVVTVHLGQGGISSVSAEDRQPLNGHLTNGKT
jgi:hypothetical protein